MGTEVKASCECGYAGSALCGSTRREHGKLFWYPHRCNHCHELVTVDLLQSPITCDKCGSQDVKRYGVVIKQIPYGWKNKLIARFNGDLRRDREARDTLNNNRVDATWSYNLDTTFGITKDLCECPACHQTTMRFRPGAIFN